MITAHLVKESNDYNFLDKVKRLLAGGLKSLECNIIADEAGDLVIDLHDKSIQSYSKPVYLDDLFRLIILLASDVQIILNFRERNLESRALFLVEDWSLKKQVKYTGLVMPSHFSLWERLNIIYPVENSLPNVYQLDSIKPAHLDVVNYFCNKFKVRTIRIHAHLIKEEVIEWCENLNLELSVDNVESMTEANHLENMGVAQISVRNSEFFLEPMIYSMMNNIDSSKVEW